ncbi:hypothetical protein TNCV_840541 [Trichonephila clavipes]|nr:hypothetical protein TNCV_840541 [Trichonephila clavipes]
MLGAPAKATAEILKRDPECSPSLEQCVQHLAQQRNGAWLRGASDRGMCHSKGGDQRKTFLPSVNNFMVSHPGQTIIDKNIPTDLDVVGDETENNSANPQTLIEENQHINSSEESELMANADYDAPKKPLMLQLQDIDNFILLLNDAPPPVPVYPLGAGAGAQ